MAKPPARTYTVGGSEVSSSGQASYRGVCQAAGAPSATGKTLTCSVVHGTAREGEAPMGRGPF